ncbi:DNA polymerase IV [Alkalihalobacillus sp. BA299]|uniref:DNA polymerase IV n=1 Tax=Alkalihalobacillus sp. BA299 TaxID=2815938 RepID=UPI001AD9B7D6|nr:DNA polymerase IV [Alkalihalobacillus sp. BA299]
MILKRQIIFHIDMNSFYASVEAAYDPSLRGKPVAVAGNVEERRGIVVTCSYEARAKGVKATMPVWQAKRLCPDLIIKAPDFTKYRSASLQMFEVLREYSPLVEPVSIDEGYMNMSHYEGAEPLQKAQDIQRRLLEHLILPCSIGIAPNKFLAKMASEMKKPLGVTVLRKRDLSTKLWPLPLLEMHGIGEKTATKLNQLGLKTIGDLAQFDSSVLKERLGIYGQKLVERANGIDERQVDPDSVSDFKSVGNSVTLPADTINHVKIKTVFTNLAHEVGRRLKIKKVCSENIQITIRYRDRKTITRSRKLTSPVQTSDDILEAALFLWSKYWNGEPIRLLGITAMDLIEESQAYKQLDLFSYKDDEKKWKLSKTVDEIRTKFGQHSLLKGGQIGEERSEQLRDQKTRGTSLDKDFLK